MQTAGGEDASGDEEEDEPDPMDAVECMICDSGADEANLLLCDGEHLLMCVRGCNVDGKPILTHAMKQEGWMSPGRHQNFDITVPDNGQLPLLG